MAKAILYTPHPNQEKIHESINNDTAKYYILNIGRQFGKTLLATNQLIYWALNNKGVKCAWVSPVYKQSKKVFDEVYKAFSKRPQIYRNVNKSELVIEYITGSTIQFFSAERYDNIRGFTFDYLVCDEFAFMDEQAWTEVLRATVLVKGKKVLLISTPKGKNHFYNLFHLDGVNNQYKSFTMTSYDNPLINPTEIDDARHTLPDHVFRQEYLAEFIDGGASPFTRWNKADAPITSKLFAGLDLGRADDYTVLTILNDEGNMVYCNRWRQDSWTSIIRQVSGVLNQYQPNTYVEVNSIGDALYEQIQSQLSNPLILQPFVTTAKSKQDIIEQLIVANQNKDITILDIGFLEKEYEVFTYEYSPKTKNVRYSAPPGFHDDCVMSHAIAYEAFKKLRIQGVYNIGFA